MTYDPTQATNSGYVTDNTVNTSHTVPAPDLFSTRLDGPAPEVEVSRDMIKRGLIVGPCSSRSAP